MQTVLKREAFATSRLLDFFSRKELTAQIGHAERDWPLVALKELVDNALDACEDQGIAPDIDVTVDEKGIAVKDNGPGLALDTVEKMLEAQFSWRRNHEFYKWH
jgi:DNA topoisomerase VI subunit B